MVSTVLYNTCLQLTHSVGGDAYITEKQNALAK